MKKTNRWKQLALSFLLLAPLAATANEWVEGEVAAIENYNAYDSNFGILISLSNKSYPFGQGLIATTCTQRFRVAVGAAGITAETQKQMLALLLAAQASGTRVRLFADPTTAYLGNYCPVQIAGAGAY
jgi:hypothetical protein